jgi:uncharacterized protein YoxC
MELLHEILVMIALIMFIALAVSLIILTTSIKKFLSDVSLNIDKLAKDMRIIREKTGEVIDEINIFSKRVNSIAAGIVDLKDIAVDSMNNLRYATYEIKQMASKFKENTNRCSSLFHNVQDTMQDVLNKVTSPFVRIGAFFEGFASIFSAFKKK